MAAANRLLPFSFLSNLRRQKFIDTSLSMTENTKNSMKATAIPSRGGMVDLKSVINKNPVCLIITDMQKNGFQEILKGKETYKGIDFRKISLPRGNLGIIDHQIGPSFAGSETKISIDVINEFNQKKNTKFQLSVDGKMFEEKKSLLHQGKNKLLFKVKLKEGPHSGFIKLIGEEAGFTFDNIRYFSTYVYPLMEVVVYSDSYPHKIISALKAPYFTVTWSKRIPDSHNKDFFISITDDERDIENLLKSSIPGIISLSAAENTSVSRKIPPRLSTITDPEETGKLLQIDKVDEISLKYSNKITTGKTLLFFEDGNPFASKDNNKLITSVSLENRNLAFSPAFIPLLYSLIKTAAAPDIKGKVLIDEPIIITSEKNPAIIDPESNSLQAEKIGDNRYLFSKTKLTGNYTVINEDKAYFSVNPSPSESELDTLTTAEREKFFKSASMHNGTVFFLFCTLILFIISIFVERR